MASKISNRRPQMRDFTTTDYNNTLWISDLLKVQTSEGKDCFISNPLTSKTIFLRNVVILGTVVEVKDLGDKGCLYYVDDGTGIVLCKYNGSNFDELLSVAEDGLSACIAEKVVVGRRTANQSASDDTVFNDTSVQLEEQESLQRCQLEGMQSLWQDLSASFSSVVRPFQLGDNVCIHGRLYTYFGKPQIYVNSIRYVSVTEECLLIRIKLNREIAEDARSRQGNTSKLSKERVTFDNIHHMEATARAAASPALKRKAPEPEDKWCKRVSLVPPQLEGAITFDTLAQEVPEEQGPSDQ